ncbi:hypothetical protein EGT74_24160 [Chitinophaga lutea]|uniref:Uncharacterized protein n=1 Tax=Chitinophaga lutea TaxID=2488634 RepID=A0A3N4PA15_9BACT|nr:hypothetical protein [Chitinophaga lutea]RPE05482.1 hypothetical protein EGT74_24160 [Chitinophaga lutea]
MKKARTGFIGVLLLQVISLAAYCQAYPAVVGDKFVNRQPAAEAWVNAEHAEVVRGGEGGVRLKKGATEHNPPVAPDVVFRVRVPLAGTYRLSTYAIPEGGAEKPQRDEKGNIVTSYIRLQLGRQRATRRIVYDRHHAAGQVTGRFELKQGEQELKIWLPPGIQLVYIEWKNYNPPAVPAAAKDYMPKIVPPPGHPRLWVTPQTLPLVKSRLTAPENKPAWDGVRATALRPYVFHCDPQQEVFYNEGLEKAAEAKAFYYLMTGDKKAGNEAVRLMTDYLSALEFGNVTYGDITREIGRAIYTASLVYDWCYPLLSRKDKAALYSNMLRLARDMEIGWPPFMDSIINGHGNEAQICRDLLAMGIALYDVDPLPYRYTAYTVLEQLVPMRKFEYASPRHNQGVDYGAYRFGWEMHAAWFYYRMTGLRVFDDNIKKLPYFWLYMRQPDGYMLRDGDMFSGKISGGKPVYWKQPQTMLLSYAYSNDAVIKGEFERQGGLPGNPVLFLLVNDPALKAEHRLAQLPLTKDFGTVLGGMVARTGWNNTDSSNDVIAEIRGGGYHFANHQHADAGALQIYYRGIQVGDIGLYVSYGTPYDFNFNKRSVAHSMMLAVDPEEKLLFRARVRDGGTRFNQRFPQTPQETVSDPWFNNGQVQSAGFGPSATAPAFSYFKADLTSAYTSKMTRYTRGFCFLNLGREDVPAVIILTDDMTTAKADFKKYWQINTLHLPDTTGGRLVLQNSRNGLTGKTYVDMLLPAPKDRIMAILSGDSANSVFGQPYQVVSDKPEAHAHRIMITPATPRLQDRFLTVFQMVAGNTKPLPVNFKAEATHYQLAIADRVVCMSAGSGLIDRSFIMKAPAGTRQVTLAGLKGGYWHIRSADGKINFTAAVADGNNTLCFDAGEGHITATPGGVDGVPVLK